MTMSILSLVLVATLSAQANGPTTSSLMEEAARVLVDPGHRTACGPIAVYVALRSIGQAVPLERIIAECRWHVGEETRFAVLADTLRRRTGVSVRAVRLPPEQLMTWLARGGRRAAILPVRTHSGSLDHAVCAVGVQGSQVLISDYPIILTFITREQLSDSWSGEALLVMESSTPVVLEIGLGVLPGLILGLLAGIALAKARRSRNRGSHHQ